MPPADDRSPEDRRLNVRTYGGVKIQDRRHALDEFPALATALRAWVDDPAPKVPRLGIVVRLRESTRHFGAEPIELHMITCRGGQEYNALRMVPMRPDDRYAVDEFNRIVFVNLMSMQADIVELFRRAIADGSLTPEDARR